MWSLNSDYKHLCICTLSYHFACSIENSNLCNFHFGIELEICLAHQSQKLDQKFTLIHRGLGVPSVHENQPPTEVVVIS